MEKRALTCIGCPMGCTLTVELEGNEVKSVERRRLRQKRSHASDPYRNQLRLCDRRYDPDGIRKDRP